MLSDNYIFNTLTECTYTIEYMHFYKRSPTCFSSYCAIFRENFIVRSKLLLIVWLQIISCFIQTHASNDFECRS